MSARVLRLATAGCATIVLAAGCTTIPSSSSPQVIHSVDVAPPVQKVLPPTPGASSRSIVYEFLAANQVEGDPDPNHNGARAFLTPAQKSRWSDSSVTVVDHVTVGNTEHRNKIVVTGREIGTIDSTDTGTDAGVYTPALRGDGTGGALLHQTFGLSKVHGQWRISALQNGLLITQAQFEDYQQRALYFFDSTNRRLVPDPRYSALYDPQELATWLVDGVAAGPLGGLQSGLRGELPNGSGQKPVVQFSPDNSMIKIDIPGAAAANRNRLAAEFAETLAQVPSITEIEITDAGTPVVIPATGSAVFSPESLFQQFTVPSAGSPPDLYYVHDSAVFTSDGRRLHGRVGAGAYDGLISAAVSANADTGDLELAAVRRANGVDYLDVGSAGQLNPTKVHGQLSRPAWAPDADEVWVGDGPELYRVSMPSRTTHHVALDVQRGSATGTIVAVRLSPEGSRVALVLRSNGVSQIYIGSVVRTGGTVRVTNLAPISPQGVLIRDVAWNDELKLFAIGTDKVDGTWGLWEVQSDGSLWSPRSNSGLPQSPDSLTVAAGALAVVSAGDTVWQQQGGSWESLAGDETFGSSPIYEE